MSVGCIHFVETRRTKSHATRLLSWPSFIIFLVSLLGPCVLLFLPCAVSVSAGTGRISVCSVPHRNIHRTRPFRCWKAPSDRILTSKGQGNWMLFILAPVSHSQPFCSFPVPPLYFPAASSPTAMNYGPDGQQDELLLSSSFSPPLPSSRVGQRVTLISQCAPFSAQWGPHRWP